MFLEELLGARFSSLYRSQPRLDTEQEVFWNAVAVAEVWAGTPESLLERLLMWEAGAGRQRDSSRPKGPRLIDLDLLLFHDEVRTVPRLVLPHPGFAEREFALRPFVELEPDAREPSGRKWSDVLAALPSQGVDPAHRTW